MNVGATSAGRRFAFMVAAVPYLIDKGSATVGELAERFDLTPEVVTELVRTIAMSGVPGETATYQDNDLFDIDWDALDQGEVILTRTIVIDRVPRLTNVEIVAIIAGLQVLDATLDQTSAAVAASILRKLNVAPRSAAEPAHQHLDDHIRVLRDAIENAHTMRFSYIDAHGEASAARLVDPLWMDRYDQGWYLRGWSHSAEAVRTFRVERISDLTDTGDVFAAHPVDMLALASDAGVMTATVRVHPTALGFLSWYADAPRSVDVATGEVIAEISYSSTDALVRSMMAYPGRVRVEHGDELRAAVEVRAATALARYSEQT